MSAWNKWTIIVSTLGLIVVLSGNWWKISSAAWVIGWAAFLAVALILLFGGRSGLNWLLRQLPGGSRQDIDRFPPESRD